MAPHALHPAGCVQFREEDYYHALSLPTSAHNGKPSLRERAPWLEGHRLVSKPILDDFLARERGPSTDSDKRLRGRPCGHASQIHNSPLLHTSPHFAPFAHPLRNRRP